MFPPMTVLGLHTRDETPGCAWAVVKPREKLREFPLRVAVSVTEPLALTAAGALAVKPALLAPAETVTDGGKVTDELLLANATLVELATAPLKLTLHVDVDGGVRFAGLHVRLDTVRVGWVMVIVVPVPVAPMAAPSPSDAERPARETTDEALVVPAAI